jgi:ABC-type branched-subunit amino acid transport system ATPase component
MLRYAALSVQPDAFPLLLMDEYFFAMSDETLDALHPRLEEIKKKMAIICIEQRRCAMAGIVDSEYTFKKGADKNTVVTKVI